MGLLQACRPNPLQCLLRLGRELSQEGVFDRLVRWEIVADLCRIEADGCELEDRGRRRMMKMRCE